MLKECKELTSSTFWSRVVPLFENDQRFHIEQGRERETGDIFKYYVLNL